MLVRYATVGLANTLITLATFTLLTHGDTPAPVASALAFAAGAINGYILNRNWTFRTPGPVTRYIAVQVLGAVTSAAAIARVDTVLPHLAAEVVVLPAVTVLTYTLARVYVFRVTRSRCAPPAGA